MHLVMRQPCSVIGNRDLMLCLKKNYSNIENTISFITASGEDKFCFMYINMTIFNR